MLVLVELFDVCIFPGLSLHSQKKIILIELMCILTLNIEAQRMLRIQVISKKKNQIKSVIAPEIGTDVFKIVLSTNSFEAL